MKIYIHTLGCKVNQFESQATASMLETMGHEIVNSPRECNAIIVNTCAVTAESVRKSRQAINHLKGQAPGAVVAVCGCWPQTEPEQARKIGADILFGSGSKQELVNAVSAALADRSSEENIDAVFSRRIFEELPAGSAINRTRALLKIEDGCVNFCTYCIIPYARGPVRSLPLDSAARKAAGLMEEGYREIVLTGIEIASYGHDLPDKPTLTDVTSAVCAAAPSCRIRLGSLEPRCVTEDFCERLSQFPNLCNHFHLSLQSGCDETLSRMNRKYDSERFYQSVELLRRYFPNCGITADLITGFPGETEEEFSKTLDFLEKCRFSHVHVFPYSVRKGTPAAAMENQVPKSVKHSRAKKAAAVAEKTEEEFLDMQLGKTLDVLFEQEENGIWSGHTSNYLLVKAPGSELKNKVLPVEITARNGLSLSGNIKSLQNLN